MATYKGIGYDTATGRTRTGTNSDDISFDSLVTATDGVNVTAVGLTVGAGGANVTGGTTSDTLTVSGDASVGGDLTVAGDIVSRGAVDILVQDNFLDLNAGNTSATALSSGFTFSLNRASSFTASTVTTFVAGSGSGPTFTNTDAGSSTALAANDIVFITGAADGGNDGLYVVDSVNQSTFPQTVTIKGTGGTAISGSTPFAQSQFTADTGNTATAYKVDLKVIAIADGTTSFKTSGGSAIAKGTTVEAFAAPGNNLGAVESDFTANGSYTELGAASSLQVAYDTGSTITTDASGPIAFTLSADNQGFSVQGNSAGDGDVSIGGTTAVSSYSLNASGAASSITSTGQNLSISTASSGELDLTAAGLLDINGAANIDIDATGTLAIDSTDSTNLTMTANDASAKVLTISAQNSGGLARLDIDAKSTITMDSGDISIGATDDSDFTVNASGKDLALVCSGGGAQELRLESAGTGANAIQLNASAGSINIDSADVIDIDAADEITIDTTSADGHIALTSAHTAGQAILISANTDAGSILDMDAGILDVDVQGEATIDATGISLDSDAASNFTTSSGALTLDGAGGVNIAGNAAEIDVTTTGAIDVNSGAFTLDASSMSLDATTSSNISLLANTASTQELEIACTNANASNDGKLSLTADLYEFAFNSLAGTGNVTAGDVLVLENSSGSARGIRADANSGLATKGLIGVAGANATAGGSLRILTGGLLNVTASANVAAAAIGGKVYVSTTAGEVSETIPSASGDVVYEVGVIVRASGTTDITILWAPKFVMEIG